MKALVGKIIIMTVNTIVLLAIKHFAGMDYVIIVAASLIISNQIFPSYPTE